jgi:hypothetical protein
MFRDKNQVSLETWSSQVTDYTTLPFTVGRGRIDSQVILMTDFARILQEDDARLMT